jgi:queuine tRNA-ribosyltransferase
MFRFDLEKESRNTRGRTGLIATSHGEIATPVFMPVGTQGTVKAMTPEELKGVGAQIVLANTYHLFLRPGHERVAKLGGLHRFMNWDRPILTDSGGYQIFSLADLRREFTEDGVVFQSHIDGGARHKLTPEIAIAIQEALGSDIMMVLDECTPYPASEETARKSMELSLRWASRCLAARSSQNALFGIVQGGMYPQLRGEYVERLISSEGESRFDGIALGGLSVGEPIPLMYEIVAASAEHMPKERPRYLMGVGTPEDIVECIDRGIDMFDCVMPTRHGRNGGIFTSSGDINIENARFAEDPAPLDERCGCYACRNYSRAYINHLFRSKEILAARLATLHNLHFYLDLIDRAALALREDRYPEFKRNFLNLRKEKV